MARRQYESDASEESEESVEHTSSDRSDSSESEESESDEDDGSEESGDDDDAEESDLLKAKYNLVEAELVEMRKMMEEMDRMKTRLQFRLGREADDAASNPSRTRSSVNDTRVPPPTISAAVQTMWDVSRILEAEETVASVEIEPTSPTTTNRQETQPPVNKSVQLSLQDLARSYGVQEALFGNDSPTHTHTLVKNSLRASHSESFRDQLDALPAKKDSHPWDDMGLGGPDSNHTSRSSQVSIDKPPKLSRSQLVPRTSHRAPSAPSPLHSALEDSFGIPASPTKSAHTRSLVTTHNQESNVEYSKTIEQKEMEAMQSLLFF